VDDFQLIALGKMSFGPAVAGHDVAIQFDGDTVLLHAELFDQIGQGKRGVVVRLTIDCEFHAILIFARNDCGSKVGPPATKTYPMIVQELMVMSASGSSFT
jgi:hypothetical protein